MSTSSCLTKSRKKLKKKYIHERIQTTRLELFWILHNWIDAETYES